MGDKWKHKCEDCRKSSLSVHWLYINGFLSSYPFNTIHRHMVSTEDDKTSLRCFNNYFRRQRFAVLHIRYAK